MASPTSSSPSNQPNVAAQRLQHGVGPAPAQQPQNITTEGVQKVSLQIVTISKELKCLPSSGLKLQTVAQYLDENESLISTIVENMNANRLKECTQ